MYMYMYTHTQRGYCRGHKTKPSRAVRANAMPQPKPKALNQSLNS